ncbi:MAG: GAF domain-containing protein [Bacteroidaceae bacterium]|nr:GAF domain-containing protein [Bacteroidaceae bacterium]
MEVTFNFTPNADKATRYREFIPQLSLLIEDEHEEVSVLANVSAALKECFDWFWIGFYLVRGEELILGPFQGSTACYRIKKGRGVCGTTWAKGCTQVVPDVEQFPGHIACSNLSRSEIVVPLFRDGYVCAVLDIDSTQLSTFDDIDRIYLEEVCKLVEKNIYQPHTTI